jgi:hypothetical protein
LRVPAEAWPEGKAEGEIDGFDTDLLEPDGGDLDGFTLVFGDPETGRPARSGRRRIATARTSPSTRTCRIQLTPSSSGAAGAAPSAQSTIRRPGFVRDVLGRAAVGEERDRLWQHWRELDRNLDSYAARRPHETAVVVLQPRRTARAE